MFGLLFIIGIIWVIVKVSAHPNQAGVNIPTAKYEPKRDMATTYSNYASSKSLSYDYENDICDYSGIPDGYEDYFEGGDLEGDSVFSGDR